MFAVHFFLLIGYSDIYSPLRDEYLDTKKVNDLICVYLKCKTELKNNVWINQNKKNIDSTYVILRGQRLKATSIIEWSYVAYTHNNIFCKEF